MKVRESGMPNEYGKSSLSQRESCGPWNLIIMQWMWLNLDVAEFGCGYGTFTIPTSKAIKGKYTLLISKKK